MQIPFKYSKCLKDSQRFEDCNATGINVDEKNASSLQEVQAETKFQAQHSHTGLAMGS